MFLSTVTRGWELNWGPLEEQHQLSKHRAISPAPSLLVWGHCQVAAQDSLELGMQARADSAVRWPQSSEPQFPSLSHKVNDSCLATYPLTAFGNNHGLAWNA